MDKPDTQRPDTGVKRKPKQYPTYAELIQKDPNETYIGGTFKDEIHTISRIEADGKRISGLMDVNNKYSGSSRFHLTQMGAYSFLAQLILGYICYKHSVTKDDLGMPTLNEFVIRWKKMIRTSHDIFAFIEERHCVQDKNRYTTEWGFEIGDGNAYGHISGTYRVRPKEEK